MKRLRLKSRSINWYPFTIVVIGAFLLILRLHQIPKLVEGQTYEVTGVLKEQPRVFGELKYFEFKGYRVKLRSREEVLYGDKLNIKGTIHEGRLVSSSFEKIGESSFDKALFRFRMSLRDKISQYFSEPAGSILSGVLLGMKEGLSKEFEENLIRTGTIHVIVVSGYNITVVAGAFLALSRFISRRISILISLLAIAFYTLLVGADPPALRAALMGSLALIGGLFGRQKFALYSLFMAGFIIILLFPETIKSISFQLSFLATAGIILFQTRFNSVLAHLPPPFSDDLATSLAAQIFVIPVIFFYFGTVSLVSPIANSLLLWAIPLATILGFVFLLSSFILPPLAGALTFVIGSLMKIFELGISFFASLPLASFELQNRRLTFIFLYILILLFIFILYVFTHRKAKKSTNS